MQTPRDVKRGEVRSDLQGQMNGGISTVEPRNHESYISAGKRRFFLIGICLISLPSLVLAAVGLYAVVCPLHKNLLAREARALADEIDSVIKERNAVLEIIVGSMTATTPPAEKDVESVVRSLRSAVPDFLSLEVIDGQGEIVAMIGELDLPHAGRVIAADKRMQREFADKPNRNQIGRASCRERV